MIRCSASAVLKVGLAPNIENSSNLKLISTEDAIVVATEYFTITGQRIYNIANLKGAFIVRNHLSDGSVTTSIILKKVEIHQLAYLYKEQHYKAHFVKMHRVGVRLSPLNRNIALFSFN